MIHTDEDDEFDRIARENALHEVYRLGQEIEGQPYHFQKREWVELTKGEIEALPDNLSKVEFAWLVETKLREKNETN
jgi:hypothetical protein